MSTPCTIIRIYMAIIEINDQKKMSETELTVKLSLYLDSKTDIAAREPEPIVANGNVSVEPWGYIWRAYSNICQNINKQMIQNRHC